MSALITNAIILILLSAGVILIIKFLAEKTKESLARKLSEEKKEKENLEIQIWEWKVKLTDSSKPVIEEEDLKLLKKETKEIRANIVKRTKEVTEAGGEIETDQALKNLKASLEQKEIDFARYDKIFKEERKSSLDVEKKKAEIEKIESQISAINKGFKLWSGWLTFSSVAIIIASSVLLFLIKGKLSSSALISSTTLWVFFLIIQSLVLYKGYTEVPEKQEYVITFFGEYFTIWEAGLHFLFPFWMKINSRVYMGDHSLALKFTTGESGAAKMDFQDASAEVIATIFFRIFSSKLAVFQPGDLKEFVSEKMEAGIRAYYGRISLDQAIEKRAEVDLRQIVIQDATEAGLFKSWGVKITSLAITDIKLPKEIDEIRQKKLSAEKEREVEEIKQKTEEITANISEIKGSAEGRRLVKLAGLLQLPLEQMVEYDKYIRHQEALAKAGVLIAGTNGQNDPASIGAIAATTATAIQKP